MFLRRRVPQEAEFKRLIERWSGFVRKTLVSLDHRRNEADLEEIEQEISAATKVDVDVNLDLNEGNEIKPDQN